VQSLTKAHTWFKIKEILQIAQESIDACLLIQTDNVAILKAKKEKNIRVAPSPAQNFY